ncbi:phage hypothetical protein [Streptococcus pyogenes]|nr:phage hypothetical protein [Streptococcus pyogenes]
MHHRSITGTSLSKKIAIFSIGNPKIKVIFASSSAPIETIPFSLFAYGVRVFHPIDCATSHCVIPLAIRSAFSRFKLIVIYILLFLFLFPFWNTFIIKPTFQIVNDFF